MRNNLQVLCLDETFSQIRNHQTFIFWEGQTLKMNRADNCLHFASYGIQQRENYHIYESIKKVRTYNIYSQSHRSSGPVRPLYIFPTATAAAQPITESLQWNKSTIRTQISLSRKHWRNGHKLGPRGKRLSWLSRLNLAVEYAVPGSDK